jgi:hypothetical protein
MSHTELVKYSGACPLGAPDLLVLKHVEPSIGDLSGEPDAHTVISRGGVTSMPSWRLKYVCGSFCSSSKIKFG